MLSHFYTLGFCGGVQQPGHACQLPSWCWGELSPSCWYLVCFDQGFFWLVLTSFIGYSLLMKNTMHRADSWFTAPTHLSGLQYSAFSYSCRDFSSGKCFLFKKNQGDGAIILPYHHLKLTALPGLGGITAECPFLSDLNPPASSPSRLSNALRCRVVWPRE